MTRIFNWVLSHPKSVLLLLLLLTGMAVNQMRQIHIETDMEAMLPHDSDAFINKQLLEERFGATDMVIIGMINEGSEGIYNQHSLALVDELTNWLQEQPQFRTLALNDLLSLSTIKDIQGSEAGLDVAQFMPEVPRTASRSNT